MLKLKVIFSWIVVCTICLVVCAAALAAAPVRVWQEPLVIPTSLTGEPDRNPRFYDGSAYQGAQGRVYPYAMIDVLTDERKDVSYKAVYLENEYIKVCILPELGGRLFYALDKTNNYDFFFHAHVIKPAMVGVLGAWVGGGIEWNFPDHHRPTGFMPLDYTFRQNGDGSATVSVGELELRHRMRWTVELTLYPGKSYIEARLKLMNRTPFIQSFLCFANAGVLANADYQVFFPPGTEFVTQHAKSEFAHWPFSHELYGGIDYTKGVDVSWFKNHPDWGSMFAWNYEDDFFGGYDHGKEAGTVNVADHHVVTGRKFWTLSAGPRGDLWEHIMTDSDGSELELMTGAYSDNQPDYSWMQPYETKDVSMYWFPVRELGGIKYANVMGAANLELREKSIWLALNTVAAHDNATVRLYSRGQVAFEQKIQIGPDRPFHREIPRPAGVQAEDLKLVLVSKSGEELIAYAPPKPKNSPMPETVAPPPPPREIKTVEELYLAGLRLQQFYNPAIDPYPYYEEALRRDPGNYQVNVALGIAYFKRGMFDQAEKCLRAAIQRVTHDYTSPRDGEALYYLGLLLKSKGKLDEAYSMLYKATWSYAFNTAAYTQLAELACVRGDHATALAQINRAIATNDWSGAALGLKASILRKLGRFAESAQLTKTVLDHDPLDFRAGYEHYLATALAGSNQEAASAQRELRTRMRDGVQSYLELAIDYGNSGFYDDASAVLRGLIEQEKHEAVVSPMVYYYLGYYAGLKGDTTQELGYYAKASKAAADYCFPFRLESIPVLQRAAEINPADARAFYYLGDLLYDLQPAAALEAWEKSRALDSSFAPVHRNLAVAYEDVSQDIPKAIASMEKAVSRDENDPRYYYELDVLYEKGGIFPEKRLAMLEKHRATIEKRDDAFSRLPLLYVQTGKYDAALAILKTRHFHNAEGSSGMQNTFVDAHLLRGLQAFSQKQYSKALEDYQAALEFPANLENAWPYGGGRTCEIFYYIGTAYEGLGEVSKAREFFQKSAGAGQESAWSNQRYYQGMALIKLREETKARALFSGLFKFAAGEADAGVAYFSKFGEKVPMNVRRSRDHYLMGLAWLGEGEKEKAKSELREAIDLDLNNAWGRIQLSLQ
jgi:tetratricopeptide (TPR) repeat protein